MKSDFIEPQVIKINAGRANFPSTVIMLRNNTLSMDEESMVHQVNLAAAYHDHISCTKLPSDIGVLQQDNTSISLGNTSLPSETDHIYATESKTTITNEKSNGMLVPNLKANASNLFTDERSQIQRLKEMILAQLDLIQHQQEQLLKKDRQLQGLKQDREALCLRLEKMEKRISILTSKVASSTVDGESNASDAEREPNTEETSLTYNNLFTDPSVFTKVYSQPSSTMTSVSTVTSVSRSTSSTIQLINEDVQVSNEGDSQLGRKSCGGKKRKTETVVIAKRKSKLSSTETESSVQNKQQTLAKTHQKLGEVKSEIQVTNDSSSAKGKTGRKRLSAKKQDIVDLEENSITISPLKSKEILTSDKLYDLSVNNGSCEDLEGDEDSCKNAGEENRNIEVPSWRLNPVSSCYSLEGTENLDDEVFLKRHSKLEVDERRRKRWDIQRLREQRHNERLRTGRYYNNSNGNFDLKRKNSELTNFVSDPKEVYAIEITDSLPLVAFGHPIPQLPKRNFSLPWVVNTDKVQNTVSKAKNSTAVKKHTN